MSLQSKRPPIPRAVIHKRILDAAAEQPEASLETLAADIPAATADLVENELDEYGDPADDEPDDPVESDESESTMAQEKDQEHNPADLDLDLDLDDLSESQRETLRTIFEHPNATQRDIADVLDVSAPTVSQRVNAIEGFDWADRQVVVETLFATREPTVQEQEQEPGENETETTDQMASNETETESPDETGGEATEHEPAESSEDMISRDGIETTIDQLAERVATLEHAVEEFPDAAELASATELESAAVLTDPALVHKVVHACLKADTITEKEELQLLKALLR